MIYIVCESQNLAPPAQTKNKIENKHETEDKEKNDVMCKCPSNATVLDEVGVGEPETGLGSYCDSARYFVSSQERQLTPI